MGLTDSEPVRDAFDPGDPGNMKGYAIREFVAWYEAELGRERLMQGWDRFTAADRAFFDHTQPHLGISALRWYPLPVIHRALDALTHGMTADERDAIAVKGGEATVRGMVRGPQGIVFALFMTPGRYGTFVNKLWRLSYDRGSCEHRVIAPRHDETRILGWTGHHPLLCHVTCAVKEALYRSIGCQDVKLVHYCVARGHTECAAEVTWSE